MEITKGESKLLQSARGHLLNKNNVVRSSRFAPMLLSLWLLPLSVVVSGAELERIAEENAQLVLHMPGFENAERKFHRKRINRKIYEYGSWVATGDLSRTAWFKYIRPRWQSTYVFTEGSVLPMPEKIKKTFSKRTRSEIGIGRSGRSSNHIGELQYQHFSLGKRLQCVFMRQFFGAHQDVDQVVGSVNPPLGDRLLQGWYCEASRDSSLSNRSRIQILESIGIRDWSMPDPQSDSIESKSMMVGILPPAFLSPTAPGNNENEARTYSAIRQHIGSQPSVDILFDYAGESDPGPTHAYAVWQGPVTKKAPDRAMMQTIGDEFAVDILMLAWIAGGNQENTTIDLYVFEVASGKTHQNTGKLTKIETLIESTLALSNMTR